MFITIHTFIPNYICLGQWFSIIFCHAPPRGQNFFSVCLVQNSAELLCHAPASARYIEVLRICARGHYQSIWIYQSVHHFIHLLLLQQATTGRYFQIKSPPLRTQFKTPMGCNVKLLFWRQIHWKRRLSLRSDKFAGMQNNINASAPASPVPFTFSHKSFATDHHSALQKVMKTF